MNLSEAMEKTCKYLASAEALSSIERDPYWPKWDSPWWHMLLLHEMGLSERIPKVAAQKMASTIKTHFMSFFPLVIEEVPEGVDPYRGIMCFCALGSIYQVLSACGINVDAEIPWMREWLLRYQLPDGGFNCDEAAYTKEVKKSSIVSTLPCLEALLFCTKRELTAAEKQVLQKGAEYLLNHGLFRRLSTGEVIDQNWLEIRFPRFYEYDFLRGFYFLIKWREYSGFEILDELTEEVISLVQKQWKNDGIILRRYNSFENMSLVPEKDGNWEKGPVSGFDLMQTVSAAGLPCPYLTEKWLEIKALLPERLFRCSC